MHQRIFKLMIFSFLFSEWNDFSSFAEFKRKNGLSIYPDVPSSDKESSDDERFTLLED